MTLLEFIEKLREGYGLSAKLGEVIVSEYGEDAVDWGASYNKLRDKGTGVSHIGHIHTCIVRETGESAQQSAQQTLEDGKRKYLREELTQPERFNELVQRSTAGRHFMACCVHIPAAGCVEINLEDLYIAAKQMPDSNERQLIIMLHDTPRISPEEAREKLNEYHGAW